MEEVKNTFPRSEVRNKKHRFQALGEGSSGERLLLVVHLVEYCCRVKCGTTQRIILEQDYQNQGSKLRPIRSHL